MSFKRVLVVSKRKPFKFWTRRRAREAHDRTLKFICQILKNSRLKFRVIDRDTRISYNPYDLVVAVGGDGTFLEAARYTCDQPILGVNSDPKHSVGRFCCCDRHSFSKLWIKLQAKRYKVRRIPRVAFKIQGKLAKYSFLNDLLICQTNPSAMSHYVMQVKGRREIQDGSGLWVATAAGSTGGIRSAGGSRRSLDSREIQYRPRELYRKPQRHYRLLGAWVRPQDLSIKSLMRGGMIYVDGDRANIALSYGQKLTFQRAAQALCMIQL